MRNLNYLPHIFQNSEGAPLSKQFEWTETQPATIRDTVTSLVEIFDTEITVEAMYQVDYNFNDGYTVTILDCGIWNHLINHICYDIFLDIEYKENISRYTRKIMLDSKVNKHA